MQNLQNLSAEKWQRIYSKAEDDGISSHFLGIKKRGELNYSRGAMRIKPQIENAILNGRSACIFGEVGIGKSFVAFDLLFDLKAHSSGEARIYYNRASILVSEFRANFKNIGKTLNEVFTKESYYYESPRDKCKIVVIDEIDDLTSADDFQILNELVISAYDRNTPLIFLGNLAVGELKANFSSKAFSRLFEMCEFFELKGADLRKEARNDNSTKK